MGYGEPVAKARNIWMKEYLDEGGLLSRRLEKLGWRELQGDGCGYAYG